MLIHRRPRSGFTPQYTYQTRWPQTSILSLKSDPGTQSPVGDASQHSLGMTANDLCLIQFFHGPAAAQRVNLKKERVEGLNGMGSKGKSPTRKRFEKRKGTLAKHISQEK
ncbi:hypothetical protein BVY10_06750 [Pseudomonas amygdali pv. morsprunorum]|nr:hypothetical protein BVY10_06750 [Pseudomonas amygdali pv. morsprunorum]